jgi:HK97 family phage prohead protease
MNTIRKVHAEKRSGLTFVLSDETKDRMGDVIMADGWELADFRKNPIALFGHRSDFVIGKWSNLRVEKQALLGDLELAAKGTSARIDEVVSLVEADVLRATSVGFRRIKSAPLDPEKPYAGERFTKQELVECSVVAVPANPNALAVAKALHISTDVQKLVFAEPGTRRESVKAAPDPMDEVIRLHAVDEWSPQQARQAKAWLAGLIKDYPFNPLYRKMHRLIDEIETVRTISVVSAEHGNKGRPA